jgi:glycosyltransferase involved in cell wall biosynthesis
VREIGADANRRLFCFAGRLTYEKGVDILLDSLTRLPSHQIDSLQLHVFGDGADRKRLQKTAAQHRLPVVFHPPVRGVARLFPAFDCVLVPSRFEGLGIVALESLAAGVPVIGSDAKGLREALPEHWPLVAPVEDAAALARLLTRVVAGTIDLSRLGKVGRKWARANFRVDDMIGNYTEAYQHFLREKTSAPPQQA